MATINGTLSADGNTATLKVDGSVGTVVASGTFGSGTLQLYVTPDATNYFLVTGATLTEAGSFNYSLPQGWDVRLTLSGSTSPDIDYWIHD